ncbi:MAG: 16S rRNA (adenine(1518)-N(6)/adenine(1519)-N(6))-dimethyltransferase RsmA [Bacteroidota bacterium]
MPLPKPKKYLGQHFLQNPDIAHQFVNSLSYHDTSRTLIEIGPGRGILTELLIQKAQPHQLYLAEVDPTLADYLKRTYPVLASHILTVNFLDLTLAEHFLGPIGVIGNLPYSQATEILFKLLADRQQVQEIVCMVQREVATRLCAQPGNKEYGVPSVLLQAFYDIEYLFTVDPTMCKPAPKVHSAVVRLRRNCTQHLACNEAMFFQLVKIGFQQRRKKLRNALKATGYTLDETDPGLLDLRAEALGVADFVKLTQGVTSSSGKLGLTEC